MSCGGERISYTNNNKNNQGYVKMSRKKLIDKIIKLMALAENNPSSQEAQAAKDKAAALMAEHDISVHEAKVKQESFETERRSTGKMRHYIPDTLLYNAVAKFNGVAFIISNREGAQYVFVGMKSDIEVTDYMFQSLVNQRTIKWNEYAGEYKMENGVNPPVRHKNGWMKCFALGVRERLVEIKKASEKKVQEYGIVPVDKSRQALAEFNKKCGTSKRTNRRFVYNSAGYTAGRNANINAGVKNNTQALPL